MIEKHSQVFVPVSVSIRLPELTENNGMASKVVPILINRETYSSENGARHWGDKEFVTFPSTPTSAYYTKDGWYTEWGDSLILSKGEEITHWLEEKENVYVLSEQELIALMNSCIYNGMCCTPSNVEEFAKNYIKSKTNPQTENK